MLVNFLLAPSTVGYSIARPNVLTLSLLVQRKGRKKGRPREQCVAQGQSLYL